MSKELPLNGSALQIQYTLEKKEVNRLDFSNNEYSVKKGKTPFATTV